MNGLITVEDYAMAKGVTPRRIRALLLEDRIPGAEKKGRDWVIPRGADILPPRSRARIGGLFKLTPSPAGQVVAGIYNQAGGVAKTTLTRDLGYLAALWGLRVLLIDMDGQANLTNWFGVRRPVKLDQTIHSVVVDGLPLPEPIRSFGVDLIPSCLNVDFIERKEAADVNRMVSLRHVLSKLDYDLILIDTPPSVGKLVNIMMIAADQLIVPVEVNHKGIEGAENVNRLIADQRLINPRLRVAAYVPTRYDSRSVESQIYLESLLNSPQMRVSPALHYRPAPYNQAITDGVPVPDLLPSSAATKDIIEVAVVVFGSLGLGVSRVESE